MTTYHDGHNRLEVTEVEDGLTRKPRIALELGEERLGGLLRMVRFTLSPDDAARLAIELLNLVGNIDDRNIIAKELGWPA